MQKNIFTDEQEDQIRRAFGRLDGELGLQTLDDARDLERIFSQVQSADPSQTYLDERLRFLDVKLDNLTHSIKALLDAKNADLLSRINQQFEQIRAQAVWRREHMSETIRSMELRGTESYDLPVFLRRQDEDRKPKGGRSGFSLFGDIFASPAYAFASFALIVSLGLAFGFQASELNALKQVEDPLRGGKEIFQIVDSPVKAAQSFQNELISENIPYQMKFESIDRIKISIPVNEKTLLLASSRRIELPQENQCVLVFEKAK
jgi:hypothetical protein